jgi:hypothetical protein
MPWGCGARCWSVEMAGLGRSGRTSPPRSMARRLHDGPRWGGLRKAAAVPGANRRRAGHGSAYHGRACCPLGGERAVPSACGGCPAGCADPRPAVQEPELAPWLPALEAMVLLPGLTAGAWSRLSSRRRSGHRGGSSFPGLEARTLVDESGRMGARLNGAAAERGALVVAGASGRGDAHPLTPGGVSRPVVTRAPGDVLVRRAQRGANRGAPRARWSRCESRDGIRAADRRSDG